MSEVMDRVMQAARAIDRIPGVDIDNLCYLVTDDEWRQIEDEMRATERFTSTIELPTFSMKVLRLEVRKRDDKRNRMKRAAEEE